MTSHHVIVNTNNELLEQNMQVACDLNTESNWVKDKVNKKKKQHKTETLASFLSFLSF